MLGGDTTVFARKEHNLFGGGLGIDTILLGKGTISVEGRIVLLEGDSIWQGAQDGAFLF